MDGYRDQIVTHDVGVSLHSKTHPLFMKYSNGTSTVLCISLSELVSCAFSTIPICPFLIHLSPLFFLLQIAISYGPGRIQSVDLCTQYTNEMCAPFCNSPNCSTDCSSHMYSCLGSGNCSNTVIDLGLVELHNVRDSVAPRSYVDSQSQAFSDSWAWLQG